MATNISTSLTYEDIKSKSVLIHSGRPALYQLTPKEEKIGTLRRMTLGEKDPNKINKTILLVGETGAGKSTLINALVNYAMGVKWEDDVWFQIVEDEKKDQTESQTSDVTVYQVFGFEGQTLPYSLTIIDTPGYGDTRGAEQDLLIIQRLLDLFRSKDGVVQINAVGLVLKASDNRLNDRLMYIYDSVVSLFGKDMEKKIVVLITHSEGRKPKNSLKALEVANIKFAKDENNQPVYFLFDNCQHEDRTEDTEELEHSYNITTKGMRQFANFLEKSDIQSLKTTVDVMNERVRLTACIQNLQERVQLVELKQKEIQQTEEGLKKHEEEMKNNENFTIEVEVVYKGTQPINAGYWGLGFYAGATRCTVCEENCHHPGCTLAWYPRDCEVMKGGHCTSCTNKCPVSAHVKDNQIYVNKTRKVQQTLRDMEEKYERGRSGCEEKKNILESLQNEMEQLEARKTACLDEAYEHAVKLDLIALNVTSISTYVHLDFLIAEMEKKGDHEKVQKLKQMASRRDPGLMKRMQNFCSSVLKR